jgi:large subunit ribosomal protein L6
VSAAKSSALSGENPAIFTKRKEKEEKLSRIGKRPIEVPASVAVSIDPGRVIVAGPLGTLQQQVPLRIKIEQSDGEILVTRPTERGEDRALHGLTRTLVANMVEGVTKGFEKRLEIQGVGYRAALRGTSLELNVGYSHSVVIEPRPGISFEVPVPTQIVVKGVDKQMVGQTAAEIRAVRKPEPYKGKGIRYEGEYVRRKVGKRA